MDNGSKSRDREFWDERARKYGSLAVGYVNDPILSEFEEELRWRAFRRVYPIVHGTVVLDAGCGVGSWCARLAQLGCKVVGTDLSLQMIRMATSALKVEYHCSAVEDLDFQAESFDLIISITVLQHITDDSQFEQAVNNIRRMLKVDGYLAVLEYSPVRVKATRPRQPHMIYRSREDWIRVFNTRDFQLVRESGIRFIGYRLYTGIAHRVLRLWPGQHLIAADGHPANWMGKLLRWATQSIDSLLARVPFISRRSDLHLFLFKKSNNLREGK